MIFYSARIAVRTMAAISLMLLCHGAMAESPRVKLVTSVGDIILELDPEKAPKTVANFLQYVNEGFYSGTIFHRVIDGFMIQGGGFTEEFEQKETRDPIPNEASNGLKNVIGTIAMARTSDPNSATAQFFINVADNDSLNHTAPTTRGWGYAVFGHVVEGMDVVEKIKTMPTERRGPFEGVPVEPVIIEQAVALETVSADSPESGGDAP